MTLTDAQRVRVIRAILGMSSKDFAARLDISAGTLTAWEHGRNTPTPQKRHALAQLCHERGIGFTPSGMPVPFKDCFMFKEEPHA